MSSRPRLKLARPCLGCGRKTRNGSRCRRCEAALDAARQARQLYRLAYSSSEYQESRRVRLQLAGGRCEREVRGTRCPAPARETNHRIPLSEARSLAEAIALCDWRNLEAVCRDHNPRGGRPSRRRQRS